MITATVMTEKKTIVRPDISSFHRIPAIKPTLN
jgi:hypothetical protein